MDRLTVAPTQDRFLLNGRPFFYLADTAWSATTNATMDEWCDYLEHRRSQGFNVIQINILPQWDRSDSVPLQIFPFPLKPNGAYDYSRVNPEYFSRAWAMVAQVREKGLIPALVVLWSNYVRGTWSTGRTLQEPMPLECVEPYVHCVLDTFAAFAPVFLVSGDTDFKSDEAAPYYLAALEVIKRRAPHLLTTLHLFPPAELPAAIVASPHLDFYMYQSGHSFRSRRPFTNALALRELPEKRPILNGEPCYEGARHYQGEGRFTSHDVRMAVWQSLLSGATAGVAYGADGIWSWHTTTGSAGFHHWRTALAFEGAWDVAFARWLFEQYGLFDLQPEAVIRDNDLAKIAVSKNQQKAAIYTPFATELEVDLDLSGYDWILIDLAKRRVAKPTLVRRNESTLIRRHDFSSDALLIGTK